MIGLIKGVVKKVNDQSLVLELNNIGLGFELQVPNASVFISEKTIQLYTYMHWNSEQGPSLYGFPSEAEKAIFTILIDCSGIGPKMAISILSQISPSELIRIANEQDAKALSTLNGIGTKKAEQIIVQLKHKIEKIIDLGLAGEDSGIAKHFKNITDVLNSLNYSRPEITLALDRLRTDCSGSEYSFDQALRKALSFLSKKM